VRGFAHLGVLRVLIRTGFKIQAVTGSSAGAIIGALFSAGYQPEEIENALNNIDSARIFQRRPHDNSSVFGLAGLYEVLERMLGDRTFEELQIPFAAVAVDLHQGQSLTLTEGSVVSAVKASIAVPGFFPPIELDGRTLIDGSVLDPVPVRAARQLAPGLPVVAVSLSPSISQFGSVNENTGLLHSLPILQRFMERFWLAQSVGIFLAAVDIGSTFISDLSLKRDRPALILRPNVYQVGLLDRVKSEPLVTAGENAALDALSKLFWLVSWRGRLACRIPALWWLLGGGSRG
jgi:NTE family protein